MKLAIIGGGGFRVPQIVEALSKRDPRQLAVNELVLHDVSEDRLRVMSEVLEQLPLQRKPQIRMTLDLVDAVSKADFVFSAIRVAGTQGRILDEQIPLSFNVLGQETVGPGGYAYAMRTIPAALRLANVVKEHAPNAWVINFTNPAGIITQAMRGVMGDRVIGICDTPIGLVRRAERALGLDDDCVEYDYVGLNHLGWLRAIRKDNVDLLPSLLDTPELLEQMEEARLIGRDWVRNLGMIPNEYLFYFYRNREALQQILDSHQTRGQFLAAQQRVFYSSALEEPQRAGALWIGAHNEREATYMAEARDVAQDGDRHAEDLEGGYQEVALDLMTALSGGTPARMILGVSNTEGGKPLIPSLADNAVVEVPCNVDANGPVPINIAPLTGVELGLVNQVKACETLVIEAVLEKDRGKAWRAIASHPIVNSTEVARSIFEEYYEQIPEVAEVFQ